MTKALFAFLMLTGARDGAVASLRLKHINLFDGSVFQDARQVKTKNSKTFTTTFFQVGAAYLDCFENWVKYLRDEKLFGSEDALFPKPLREFKDGQFVFEKLSQENYSSPAKFISVIRHAFAVV